MNADPQVAGLVCEIRGRRASYRLSQSGDLEARLEALPVITDYRAAERALRDLFGAVNGVIGEAAGIGFSGYVHPQGHG